MRSCADEILLRVGRNGNDVRVMCRWYSAASRRDGSDVRVMYRWDSVESRRDGSDVRVMCR